MSPVANAKAFVALLEQLSEPLLVINVAGNVTYANAAAKALPGELPRALTGHPEIRALVRDVALGKRSLPQEMSVALPGDTAVAGRFVTGPSGMDVAFLPGGSAAVERGSPGDGGQLPLRQIIDLLRCDLMPPVGELLDSLAVLPPGAATSQLQRAALEVGDRLGRLADLVGVFGDDTLVEDDRVVIPDLMRRVCRELAPMAERYRVQFVIRGDHRELPPIYGSAKLLHRAFRECLDSAIRHARHSMHTRDWLDVEVRYKAAGQYLLVAVINHGATGAPRHSGFMPLPFEAGPAVPQDDAGTAHIGLPLARRILELHGGQVRISDDADDDTVEVLLELPTGAPRRGSSRLDIAQAQRYAADLAKLMSRQRKIPQ